MKPHPFSLDDFRTPPPTLPPSGEKFPDSSDDGGHWLVLFLFLGTMALIIAWVVAIRRGGYSIPLLQPIETPQPINQALPVKPNQNLA